MFVKKTSSTLLLAVLSAQIAPSFAQAKSTSWNTLDGQPSLVISHRGFPGIRPEETAPAYLLAADAGSDALEMDLHLTKDCQLVARHNPWLADNTNIKEVALQNPEVAARKRTVPGVMHKVAWARTDNNGPTEYLSDVTNPNDPKSVLKSLVVDGADHTNDWSISDFTMAELRAWVRGTTYDAADERPKEFNGQFPIISFQEIIDIAKQKSRETGRTIAVYPETKNPTWNNAQAIANGCGSVGSRPFEDALMAILEKNHLNDKNAPVFVQSFEPSSLKYLRSKGLKTRAVQLIGANDVDFKTGEMVYDDIPNSRPYDWTLKGNPNWFSAMLTPEGLAEIKTYADGIGAWKPQVIPFKMDNWIDSNPDGTPFKAKTVNATTQNPTPLIKDAHRLGLFVHVYTFRNEGKYLAANYQNNPELEYFNFFKAGVDGVFTDFTSTGVKARDSYLK